jgi:hypothetical protein
MFDMTKCKAGDFVQAACGRVYEYVDTAGCQDRYPHRLRYVVSDGIYTYADNGMFMLTATTDDIKQYDIVGFVTAKTKCIRRAKPVNKLLGVLEWIATRSHSKMFTEHDYIRGSFCILDAQFQFEYHPKSTKALIAGAGEVRWTIVHTLNNFKGAVTKLMKG